MKLALITDQHWGVKNSNPIFHDYMHKFYDEVFFPYLKNHNITNVIMLGDTVEHRKYVNYYALTRLRQEYFYRLRDMGIKVDVIVGNHDLYYKNSSQIDAMTELFSDIENLNIITKPETIQYDGVKIDLVPWIHSGNFKEVQTFMAASQSLILMAHLEVQGFEMFKGMKSEHGFKKSFFNKYEMVMSGHFHHKSDDGHIYYLGSPYQLTWSDYGDPRGFHIFDTENRSLKLIENPYSLFQQIVYDDTKKLNFQYNNFTNKILKIIIRKTTDPVQYEQFLSNVYKNSPYQVQIISQEQLESEELNEDTEVEDTHSIIMNYVDGLKEEKEKKKRVKKIVNHLYMEAISDVEKES